MKKTNKKQKKQFKGSQWLADAIREDRKNGLTYNAIVEKYAQKNIKFSSGYVYQIIANKIRKKIDTKKIEDLSNLIKSGDNSFLQKKIEDLCFSKRASNALKHSEIETIGQLISYSEIDLMGFEKFGKVSLHNIKERLAQVGLSLKKLQYQYTINYYSSYYSKSIKRNYWRKLISKNMGIITQTELDRILNNSITDTKTILKKTWCGATRTIFSQDGTRKTVYDYTLKW